MTVDRAINVIGKACPLPLIALAKAVDELAAGQLVEITGNDPIFEESIVELCRERGHEVLQTERDGRVVRMVIRV